MHAAVITEPGRACITAVPAPAPAPGEVLIRVEGSGVCGSDLTPWQGRPWLSYPLPPGAPGHEGWGRVESIGGEVATVVPGARVAFLSSCAYAEYATAPADHVVALPKFLEGRLFPAESLGCAMNVLRRSDIRRGQMVVVVGAGFLGLLLIQLASRAGAHVIAISRRGFALEVAQRFGASARVTLDNPSRVAAEVRRLTGTDGCPRVIEAAGSQATLDLASQLTAERGRLIIAGYHQDGPRAVNMQLWNWRGLDVVNAHERAPAVYVEGMRAAIEAVGSGQLDPWPLFTHTLPLEEVDHALDLLHRRPDGFVKAAVAVP
jgi:threonine dehydrogenase-like Zn-dependent dehydrogenase